MPFNDIYRGQVELLVCPILFAADYLSGELRQLTLGVTRKVGLPDDTPGLLR